MRSTRSRGRAARVVVILGLAMAALIMIRNLPKPQPIEVSAPLYTPTSSVSASPGSTSESAATPEPSATFSLTGAQWEKTATAFATAYTNTAGGQQAWLARLKPLTTPSVYAGFATTDIANVPVGELGSGSVYVAEEGGDGGTMRFPIADADVAGLEVTVTRGADGKVVVTQVLPVQ